MNQYKNNSKTNQSESISILELSAKEAREHLLKQESFCSLDLPPYFVFDDLLNKVKKFLEGKNLSEFYHKNPREFENVNYKILNNKNGKYDWRPFQLIHPAIYVSLVQKITEEKNWKTIKNKFNKYSENSQIECVSIPRISLGKEKDKAKQITHWWHEIEQKSIELALEYQYLFETDITDCYGSIYTHLIARAIHTKKIAKAESRNKKLIGNIIDNHIMDMNQGQTNCIPQGSVLMDLIAEIVLGYADMELANKLTNIDGYKILRYRDDYRIFYNNPQIGDKIVKALTEVMIDLGLKLNSEKTKTCNNVIAESIKEDKLAWIQRKQYEKDIQRQMLIIHDHSMNYPNSGSLVVALNKYHQRISNIKKYIQTLPLISVVVDIAFYNPRTYPICAAILSKLIILQKEENEKLEVIDKIMKKFSIIPNTGYMEIWLQRATINYKDDLEFKEPLCNIVKGEDKTIWNNDWLSCKSLKDLISGKMIIDIDLISKLKPVISPKEVELFATKAREYY
jgi:RNA-directed DNA polymerase